MVTLFPWLYARNYLKTSLFPYIIFIVVLRNVLRQMLAQTVSCVTERTAPAARTGGRSQYRCVWAATELLMLEIPVESESNTVNTIYFFGKLLIFYLITESNSGLYFHQNSAARSLFGSQSGRKPTFLPPRGRSQTCTGRADRDTTIV